MPDPLPLPSIAPLVLFAVVSTVSPGGATTLATASGSQFGFRRSIPLMVGIAVGLASLAAGAAAGLAGLLMAAPGLLLAMKAMGSAYLLWLNPKGWAMALGAAASFAMLASGPLQLAALLGTTFGLAALLSLSLWCAAGIVLARLLKTQRQWRVLNAVLGALLAASILPMWQP